MHAEPEEEPPEAPQEPLKRYTKEALKEYKKTMQDAPREPSKAEPQATLGQKVVLAGLLEGNRNAPQLEQPFPRSFGAAPCKSPCEPQPKAKIMAVLLVVVFFVGLGAYLLWQRHLDKNKPHVPPKNMPMHMIGGLKSPQE